MIVGVDSVPCAMAPKYGFGNLAVQLRAEWQVFGSKLVPFLDAHQMHAMRSRVGDFYHGVARKLPLDVEVPGLHIRLLGISVKYKQRLTEVRQQARRAAGRIAETGRKWIRKQRVRR